MPSAPDIDANRRAHLDREKERLAFLRDFVLNVARGEAGAIAGAMTRAAVVMAGNEYWKLLEEERKKGQAALP